MNTNLQKLLDVLTELKNVSITSTPDTIREIMGKYNMLFLGAKFNTIYSTELHSCLNNYFNFDITMDELNSLIPTACSMLNMKFEKIVAVETMGTNNPAISYQISL